MKTICKKCGSTLFWRNYHAGGWWTQLVESTENGMEISDTNLDNVRLGHEPKTMICCDCKRRVRNPDYK